MPFGDHLEELRRSIIRALIGVAVGTAISLVFAKDIIMFLCQPLFAVQELSGLPAHVQALAPQAAFMVYLKVGFLSGLIVAMPWVLIQVWHFVASGLYPREQRWARYYMPVSIGLFALGVAFLFAVVLPIVLSYFVRFNMSFSELHVEPSWLQRLIIGGSKESSKTDAEADQGGQAPQTVPLSNEDASDNAEVLLESTQPKVAEQPLPTISQFEEDPQDPAVGQMWVNTTTRRLMIKTEDGVWSMRLDTTVRRSSINSQFAINFYVSFVLMLALAFGLAFELPIAVWFVSRTGLASTADMGRSRKYVVLGLVVVAAVLTPPDVISQIMLAVPMYGLFEIGLLVARVGEKRREETDVRADV